MRDDRDLSLGEILGKLDIVGIFTEILFVECLFFQ